MKYIKPLVNKGNIKIVTEQAANNWECKNAFNIFSDSLIDSKSKIDVPSILITPILVNKYNI